MMLGRRAEKAEKRFKSLTKLLIEKLKEAIIAGKFAPGERLSESALATSLKVGTRRLARSAPQPRSPRLCHFPAAG